ncbi:hypothetical protein KUTeg_022057 [Tegillarca granosa]|uniref:Uncharacterized protein n=1 Tax=Tegillarca granosa TaxID=220873 RepID=A0ABQ9EBA4_TEGGR|nr:hypothetical protein KUTeg_022057 [Tegillarca granosa]
MNYDPRHTDDRQRDSNAFEFLCKALQSANPTCGFMKYNSTDCPLNDQDGFHTSRCYNLVYPPSKYELKCACKQFKNSLVMDDKEICELEFSTREQTNSATWHIARKHRLTASNFHKIGFRRKQGPSNLLNDLLYRSVKKHKAMVLV